jgi:hypothetical protein
VVTLATRAGDAALDHRREHVGNRHRLRAVLEAAWEWVLQRDTAPWLSPMARAPTSNPDTAAPALLIGAAAITEAAYLG